MKDRNIIQRRDEFYASFKITSVCRADLESAGFNVSNVDDSQMAELASKMADSYCDFGFWEDLKTLAEDMGIKKFKTETI